MNSISTTWPDDNKTALYSVADAADEIGMSEKKFTELLDTGAFLDNNEIGKDRRVIFNRFGPVQPPEYLDYCRAKKAFNDFMAKRKSQAVKK